MATNYTRGRAAEYKAKRTLEGMGYHVTRAASSQGLADLVAVRADGFRLVQCKLTSSGDFSEDENCQKLRDLPVPMNCVKELWLYLKDEGLIEVRDLKEPRPDARTADGKAARERARERAKRTTLIAKPTRNLK
jgi:hypothetical protein